MLSNRQGNFWGLVTKIGPGKTTEGDIIRAQRSYPNPGNGIPTGGTEHAGHANWAYSNGPSSNGRPSSNFSTYRQTSIVSGPIDNGSLRVTPGKVRRKKKAVGQKQVTQTNQKAGLNQNSGPPELGGEDSTASSPVDLSPSKVVSPYVPSAPTAEQPITVPEDYEDSPTSSMDTTEQLDYEDFSQSAYNAIFATSDGPGNPFDDAYRVDQSPLKIEMTDNQLAYTVTEPEDLLQLIPTITPTPLYVNTNVIDLTMDDPSPKSPTIDYGPRTGYGKDIRAEKASKKHQRLAREKREKYRASEKKADTYLKNANDKPAQKKQKPENVKTIKPSKKKVITKSPASSIASPEVIKYGIPKDPGTLVPERKRKRPDEKAGIAKKRKTKKAGPRTRIDTNVPRTNASRRKEAKSKPKKDDKLPSPKTRAAKKRAAR